MFSNIKESYLRLHPAILSSSLLFSDVLPGRCTAIIETADQYSSGDFKVFNAKGKR